jgi:methylisocitrate lyase
MIPNSPGKALREAVQGVTIPVPGAFNALVARMLEQAGFDALYLSGAAFSASVFALPDVGLFTLTELVQQTNLLTRRVEIPIIVDADTGFGEAVNVERTVTELEAAGAAAIQLEDQLLPKRCGHLSGKTLVEPAVMCAKLRAAVAAREDSDFVIIARTDARGVDGMDEAVRRAQLYLEAGADWIFPEALANEEEFAEFARRVQAPLLANMTEFGKSQLLSLDVLSELNYAVVLYPVTLLRVAMQSVQRAIETIRREGTQASLLNEMQTRQELYDLIEYEAYEARDKEYFGRGK